MLSVTHHGLAVTTLILLIIAPVILAADRPDSVYWPQFGNTEKGHRFSPITLFNRTNVDKLRLAWTFEYNRTDSRVWNHESMGIMVEDGNGRDIIAMCSPWNDVHVLDPTTGEEIWNVTEFGIPVHSQNLYSIGLKTCRGLTSWLDPQKEDGELCRRVLYMNTVSALLIAMDAATGQLCPEFGDGGVLNISVPNAITLNSKGEPRQVYGMSSSPAVIRNIIVTGDSIGDQTNIKTAKGTPRGWHCRTGQMVWKFNVIPDSDDPIAYATWSEGTNNTGGGNVWAPIGGDAETGLVYVASSSAHFDHWGGNRVGDNLYASSVIAIDVETGVKKWHYQIIKHNIWNYDLPAQPLVTTITSEGRLKKVVLQATKTGALFVLDALTGVPHYEVEEVPVPPSTVPGEVTSPTQKIPKGRLGRLVPHSFNPNVDFLTDQESGLTDGHEAYCRDMLYNASMFNSPDGWGRIFTPYRLGSANLITPGEFGGANWMSLSVDQDRQVAIIPMNHNLMAKVIRPAGEPEQAYCEETPELRDSPYNACHRMFYGKGGITPCYRPPWARLIAVNLTSGEVIWERPYGDPMGPGNINESYGARRVVGGQLITASGLIIGSGSEDQDLRIHDIETGELLMTYHLDQVVSAIPSTYVTGGKQYIVINAGWHFTSEEFIKESGIMYAFSVED